MDNIIRDPRDPPRRHPGNVAITGGEMSALEALDRGRKPDLVFSDVVLPGELNGLALAGRIRERFPDLPVLLTTGYAKALGPRPDFHVLRKPYQISALGRAVRNAIDSSKVARTVRAS